MSKFISNVEKGLSKILKDRYPWVDKVVLNVEDSRYSDNGKVILYGIHVNDIHIDYEEQSVVSRFIGEFHSSLSTGGMYSNYTIVPDGTKTSFPYFLHMPALAHLRESVGYTQKYIDYVTDDILSQITIEEDIISFPWMMASLAYEYSDGGTEFPFTYDEITNITPFRSIDFNDNTMFEYYVGSKYGAKTSEILGIWLRVKKKLINMVR
jgi:hypothetical protein|tara:strand:+ start:36 stop:662 length:627 start_codon:yes stop_codon:yes gene_type:complete